LKTTPTTPLRISKFLLCERGRREVKRGEL